MDFGRRPSFKLKKVESQLKKATDKFAELLPKQFREEFKEKSFLGGGAIYCLYNGKEPKDYDFFLKDKELGDRLRTYFVDNDRLKYKNGVLVSTYNNKRLVVTDNAISIGDYQIITRWSGTPKEVIREFDFKHNMYYFCNNRIEALTKWKYLDDNKLYYNEERARDICGTIIRVKKFVERGFTITNSEMSKMLLKLHDVGFNERELEILKSHDENRNNFGS
ncbi:hypothetical protein P9294_gp032 [Bacillus phage FADO]|uniref:Uncharacterized protein n=1 Tax=Bacillus phage FADO TaxID=2917160 RepID=A0AAE9GAF0_9CAUD|nr:hypothetical protein P9294_gp032 [Bacillus phage FADO]UNY48747.1 hypothetical protein fado_32 [Bacillus phage FADO]